MNKIIVKNALWLFTGQTIGRIFRVFILIYSARVLGAASWGALSYVLSLAAFFTIFSDIGINALVIKEASKNPGSRLKYLSTAFFIKAIILTTIIIFALVFRNYLTNIEEARPLIGLMVFIVVFDSLRNLGSSIARAMEKMEIESGVNIFTNAAIMVAGLIVLKINPTSYLMMLAYVLGTAAGFLAMVFVLRNHIKGLFSYFDKRLVRPIFSSAWPFGIIGLTSVIMINIDVLILGWMVPAAEVGFYAAAQRPIQFFYILPSIIASAFFPTLARLIKSKNDFRSIFEQGLKMSFLFSIPMTIGGVILAKPIIVGLYGLEYLPATISFLILCLTLIITFPTSLIINAIFAFDKQRSVLPYSIAGIISNTVLNILLIPYLGIAGCALATLINQTAINIYLWIKMKNINYFTIFNHLTKIIPASFIMGGLTLILELSGVNVWINLAVSVVFYFTVLWGFNEGTLKILYSYLRPKNGL